MPDCPSSPFVGLVPFREADAPFFRGRDRERDLIVEKLRSSRLTLLYGASGVGKSSVLHAGAAHRLRELARHDLHEYGKPEFVVVTLGKWQDDPIKALLGNINEAVADALQVRNLTAVPESSDLTRTIDAWNERYGIELLIILDQFEEYFQHRPREQGPGTFAEEFQRAVNHPSIRARFLVSMRDDAVSKLDRFKSRVPNMYDNMLRIQHLSEEGAREAIKEPIDIYNERCGLKGTEREYSIDPELVNEILKQVPRQIDGGLGPPGIAAPYLQLVLTRLWEKEHTGEAPSRVLNKQTLEDLKGIKNIVQVHFEDALKKLEPEQVEAAFHMLKHLVTPGGTKIAYYKSDLIAQPELSEENIDAVVKQLDEGRILRTVPSVERPDDPRYEIYHDLLGQAIRTWQTQYEASTRAIAEQASVAAELAEAERQRREEARIRQNRLLWGGISVLALLLLIAVAAILYARRENARAQQQTALAIQRLKEATELQTKTTELETKTTELKTQVTGLVANIQQEESSSGRVVKEGDQIRRRLWQNGKTLHIRFMGGTSTLHERIEKIAEAWTQTGANIKFAFDNSRAAEIRIGFADEGISWSYVGTNALTIPDAEPTMNLGLLTQRGLSEDEFRRAVLHEFGHALGLIHENQNPRANIPWNKKAVYDIYSGPPHNWHLDVIDHNFFKQDTGEYREFDRDSIMMYFPIPKELLLGDSFQPIPELSTVLSESDKAFIKELYPPK